MSEGIQEKLNRLKEYFNEVGNPSEVEELNSWEKSLKAALLKDNLANHDGVKMLLTEYVREVNAINEQLLNNKDLSETDRKLMFLRKEWCKKLLEYFSFARVTIKKLTSDIESEFQRIDEDRV